MRPRQKGLRISGKSGNFAGCLSATKGFKELKELKELKGSAVAKRRASGQAAAGGAASRQASKRLQPSPDLFPRLKPSPAPKLWQPQALKQPGYRSY